jgi:pentatricopeptide repeat protein
MNPSGLYDRLLKAAPALILALFIAQAALSARLEKWVHPVPFQAGETRQMDKQVSSTLRAMAFLSGYKVLVGHIFWIQVIQYYGDADNASTRFGKLYDYCSLASDLNPRFISIYTFGGSALAFHLRRINEAAKLLEKGIAANPHAERLKFILAAILYENTEKAGAAIPVLEEEAGRPDAPPMLVNILANSYKKVGRYQDAIRVWKRILQTGETNEQKIDAAQKLQELYSIIKKEKAAGPRINADENR